MNYSESLTADEQLRYAQQIKLDQIGIVGQEKLKAARVLCVGAGGLGAPLLWYLAAAGVGTLGIIDDDNVALDNLQRQILFQTAHIGQAKTQAAQQQLTALNPQITIETHTLRLTRDNAVQLFNQYDIIADCSDNFTTRYLVNDICYTLNKPYAFASVVQTSGQCTLFLGKQGPCLRCLFPNPADPTAIADCKSAGVLGVLPGLLGIIQATEIIKWILQQGISLARRLLCVDSFTLQFQQYQFNRAANCALCSLQQPLEQLAQPSSCEQPNLAAYAINAAELRDKLKNEKLLLVDVRTLAEHEQANLGGRLIPLAELPARLTEFDQQQTIVLYCRSGKRSQQALQYFLNARFSKVYYLIGGIESW